MPTRCVWVFFVALSLPWFWAFFEWVFNILFTSVRWNRENESIHSQPQGIGWNFHTIPCRVPYRGLRGMANIIYRKGFKKHFPFKTVKDALMLNWCSTTKNTFGKHADGSYLLFDIVFVFVFLNKITYFSCLLSPMRTTHTQPERRGGLCGWLIASSQRNQHVPDCGKINHSR